MTFYNVISGLLFVGGFQQLLLALAPFDWPKLSMAASLVLLIFNDAVYTSHVVEGEKSLEYKLPFMLKDLLNFTLLSTAIVILNPETNAFDAKMESVKHHLTANKYWLVLMVSWLIVIKWTYDAGRYNPDYLVKRLVENADVITAKYRIKYPWTLRLGTSAVVGIFGLLSLAEWQQYERMAFVLRFVAPLWLLFYLGGFRPMWLEAWEFRQAETVFNAPQQVLAAAKEKPEGRRWYDDMVRRRTDQQEQTIE